MIIVIEWSKKTLYLKMKRMRYLMSERIPLIESFLSILTRSLAQNHQTLHSLLSIFSSPETLLTPQTHIF